MFKESDVTFAHKLSRSELVASSFEIPRLKSVLHSVGCLALILLLLGCAEQRQRTVRELPPQSTVDDTTFSPEVRDVRRRVPAPWDGLVRMVAPELLQAEQLEDSGQLREALDAYAAVQQNSETREVRDAAFLLRAGLMLKLGRSQDVLSEISKDVKAQGLSASEIDSLRAILASFAYTHQHNRDQALAWIGVAIRRSGSNAEIASASKNEAYRLVRTVGSGDFDAIALRWMNDPIIGPIFAEERAHREKGARAEPDVSVRWFTPETYGILPDGMGGLVGLPPAQGMQDPELGGLIQPPYVPRPGETVVGILLPLTGKYGEHGEKVKRGIELAFSLLGGAVPLHVEYADTAGEPDLASQEYERLAHSGAAVVLGPLLLKTTESVAQKSKALKVPFISFTKKKGIPQLGQSVFRLGATVEDQVREIVDYARNTRKLETFSILTPDTENGEEYSRAFESELKRSGGQLFRKIVYRQGDAAALNSSLQVIMADSPQAIYVPESLTETGSTLANAKISAPQLVILGSAMWDDLAALKTFGPALEGAVFVSPFYLASSSPPVVEFTQQYRQKYGHEPELLAAQGYDAARLALNAINSLPKTAAEPRGPNIINGGILNSRLALSQPYTGATGKLTVANRDFLRRMSVLGVRDGSVVELATGGEIRDPGFTDNAEETKEFQLNANR